MLNTSFEYKRLAQQGVRHYIKARLVLADGQDMELTGDDFMDTNPSFFQATSSSGSFDIGAAITGSFSATLNNSDRRFDEIDFTGAKLIVSIGIEVASDEIEWLRKGTFWIEQPSCYDAVIAIECKDSMIFFDVPVSEVGLSFPIQAANAAADICAHCGVPLQSMAFANASTVLRCDEDELDMTCREAISYIAQATGNFARITNEDKLEIGWYDITAFDDEDWLDGDRFDDDNPYSSGDTANGGDFDDYASGDAYDGGSFDSGKIANVYAYSSASVMTDDVVVTGLKVTAQDQVSEDGSKGDYGETAFIGEEGYVLTVEGNPFITYGNADSFAAIIANQVMGLRFRPFDVACFGDPRVEPGDAVTITDRHQNVHRSFLTSVTYKIGAYAVYKCDAEAPLRNTGSYSSVLTKAEKTAKKLVQAEKTARENAIDRLNEDLADSAGMYTTEKIENGATTYYMHDKKELAQSQFVWKINSAGLGISVDGGKKFEFGIDKWGTAILNSIYAVGINADYITAGSLRVKSENKTIFCADVKAGQFWWDAEYSKLTNSGVLTVKKGTIGGFTISEKSLWNQNMSLTADGLGFGTVFTLNKTGMHFFGEKGSIGHVSINGITNRPLWRGLYFTLSYDDGWFMGWAAQKKSDTNPIVVMLYSNTDDSYFTRDQMHLGCDMNLHNFALRNTIIDQSCRVNGGVNGTVKITYASGYKSGTNTLQLRAYEMRFSYGFLVGTNAYPVN